MYRLKALLAIFLFIMGLTVSSAQEQIKKSNYIYIFDCTKSMIYYDILDNTLTFLHDDIGERIPGNEITVVLFQGKPLEVVHFLREDFNAQKWAELEELIRSHAQNVTNTNICSAWEKSLDFIDEGKYNYIYLMTDGEDNAHGDRGTQMVCQLIRDWCDKYRDARAYYVELYEGAMNQDILDAIKESCSILPISSNYHGHFMSFDKRQIIVNTRELDCAVRLHSDWSREVPLEITSDDAYFKVSVKDGKLKEGGVADFLVEPRISLQEFNDAIGHAPEHRFHITVSTPQEDLNIESPDLEVIVVNKPERVLNTGLTGGADLGCAEYYEGFAFFGEKDMDTLSLDLKLQFNDDARLSGSYIKMQLCSDREDDAFTLLYNGQECDDNTFTANCNDGQSLLQLVFDRKAPEGERNFTVNVTESYELDRINQSEPADFVLKLEAEYDIDWNPGKTICMWIFIVLCGLLLVWMALLKYIKYPRFKGIRRLTLEDQIDTTYYKTVPAKGYRQIVLCDKAPKQSWLSKVFCGKIYYEVDMRWTAHVEITPEGRGVHVKTGTQYIADKYNCKAGDFLTIEGTERKLKVTITIY